MDQLKFTSTWGGKIFNDQFGTVRLHQPERFVPGASLQVLLNSQVLGVAQIVAVREFQFKQIRDVLSYLDTGKPASYLASELLWPYQAP